MNAGMMNQLVKVAHQSVQTTNPTPTPTNAKGDQSSELGLVMQLGQKMDFATSLQQVMQQAGLTEEQSNSVMGNILHQLQQLLHQLIGETAGQMEKLDHEFMSEMMPTLEEALSQMMQALAASSDTSSDTKSGKLLMEGIQTPGAVPLNVMLLNSSMPEGMREALQSLGKAIDSALVELSNQKQSTHSETHQQWKQVAEQLGMEIREFKGLLQQVTSSQKGFAETLLQLQGYKLNSMEGKPNSTLTTNNGNPSNTSNATVAANTLHTLGSNSESNKSLAQLAQQVQATIDSKATEVTRSSTQAVTNNVIPPEGDAPKTVQNPSTPMMHATVEAVSKGAEMGATISKTDAMPRMSLQNFAEEFSKLVIKRLDASQLNGTSQARIQLVPEHLGQIDIQLKMKNGQLTAQIVTDRVVGKEMIDAQLGMLRSSLTSQGIQIEKLEVTHQSAQQGHLQDQRHQQSHSSKSYQQRNEYDNSGNFEDALIDEEDGNFNPRRVWQGGAFDATA